MINVKLVRSPAASRLVVGVVAAFVLAAGGQRADAAPSTTGSGSPSSLGNTSSASSTVTPSDPVTPSRSSHPVSVPTGTSSSASKATRVTGSSTAATASSSAPATCPEQVRITLGRMTVSGGMVSIAFSHNAHHCPSARPARLHLHQNLLTAPRAGSDPVHQWNSDLAIGPSHADGVTVPLLESADGKCFVQVDAHASGHTRGQFFPTVKCSSATPSSIAPTFTAPESSSPAQSFLPESTSRATATRSVVAIARYNASPPAGSLASTGSRPVAPLILAALLLLGGAWLVSWGRRPRRH
jgi:hypothetical protein